MTPERGPLIEMEDLYGIRFEAMSPPYWPGVRMAGGERPWAEPEHKAERRLDRASVVLAVACLVGLALMAAIGLGW